MPCLNRVRYVNFRYGQNGSMVMRDKSFDLAGESTLFNLVNSGGKTSLIHMMAQAVIPNASFDKRKLDLYFQGEPHTTHVLIEWVLDGDSGYLLTGFCAKGGHGQVQRWLAYQHHYYYDNPFSLDRIPVIVDDQVTLYDKFSSILRQAKQSGTSLSVYFDDEKTKYMNDLINYGIIAKEWEMHLRINMKETDGLRAYYGKWKTSKELMEHEIIPKIDDKVQAKQPLSDYHACLQKHYSQLCQEPRIRAEIADLRALEPMIAKWSSAAEQLEIAEQAQAAADTELSRFRLGVTEQADDVEAGLTEAQEKETSLIARQRQTEFEIKSLELYNVRATIAEINHLISVKETGIQADEAERAGIQTRLTEALAVDLFRILEDREYDVEKLRTEQHNAAAGQEELKEKLITTGSILAAYARAAIERLDQEIATYKQKMLALEQGRQDTEQAVAGDQQQLQQVSARVEVLKYQIQQFTDGVYKEAEDALSPLEFIDLETAPDAFVVKADRNLKQLEKISKEVNACLSEAQSRKESLLTQVTELEKTLQQWQFARERQVDFCKRHEKAETDIMARLIGFVTDAQDVYNARAKTKMAERRQHYEARYKDCEERLRELWPEQKKLSGDFYVATGHITTLVSELHRIGIQEAIAGSAYLLNQPNADSLLALHPELPYAVVVNRQSISRLQQRSNALAISAPTILLARESLGDNVSAEAESFVITLAKDIHAVRPDDFRYYLSREEYTTLKTKVQNEVDQMEQEKTVCRNQQSHISGLLDAANQYLENFPLDAYLAVQAEVRRIEGEISDLTEQSGILKGDIKQLTTTIDELITRAAAAVTNVNATAALKALVERFTRDHRANAETKQQLATCEKQLAELQGKFDEGKRCIDRIHNEQRQTERLIYNTERLKEEPDDILEAVMGYSQPISCDTAAVDSNRLSAEFQGLKTLYEGTVQEADLLARKIMEAERARNKAEREFTELGVNRERCKQLYPQTDYVKDQWRKQISELTELIRCHEMEKMRLTGKLDSPQEAETKLLKDIHRHFGYEPQTEFDDGVTLDSLAELSKRIKAAIAEVGKVIEEHKKRLDILTNIKNSLKEEQLSPVNDPLPFAFSDALMLSAKLGKARSQAAVNVATARSVVTQAVHALSRYERISDSKPVEDLVRKFGSGDTALFSGEVARKKAQEISMIIEDQVRALELQKARIDEDRNEIIDSLLKWTEFANDEIHELVSCSRIKLQDSRRALVEIRKLEKPSEEQMRERLALFITEIIGKLNDNYQADADEAKLTVAIAGYLSAYNILDKTVNVSAAEVMVWLAEINPGASRMIPWEEGQSGGQGLLTAFVMYITLMTYTSKEHGKINQTKTLFADNPFGIANAEHLLTVLFGILHENRIQLMAYTGIEDKNIYRRFPRVFLLRPVDSANKRYTVLHTEQIKSGSGTIALQEAVARRVDLMNYSLFDEE